MEHGYRVSCWFGAFERYAGDGILGISLHVQAGSDGSKKISIIVGGYEFSTHRHHGFCGRIHSPVDRSTGFQNTPVLGTAQVKCDTPVVCAHWVGGMFTGREGKVAQ